MEKFVEIARPKGTMRGMIHYPDSGQGPYPALAIFHGFQDNRMGSESLFVALSRYLAGKGFANVRFDFLGSGESDGSFADSTLSDELDDALAIIEWLGMQPDIDRNRFAIFGHSMGGSLAGMLAGLVERGAVKNPGVPIRSVTLLAPAGEIKDRVNEEIARRGIHITVDSALFKAMKFPIPVGGELMGKAFFADLAKYSVMDATASYSGPILLIQGDEDHAVSPAIARLYPEKIPNCELRIVKGARHKFNSASSRKEMFAIVAGHLARYL